MTTNAPTAGEAAQIIYVDTQLRERNIDSSIDVAGPDDLRKVWTISRYSDERGAAYDLEATLKEDLHLSAQTDFDAEAGCFFAYTDTPEAAVYLATKLDELLTPLGAPTLEEQADAENAFWEAANRLDEDHGYSLEDLIELLTSREG